METSKTELLDNFSSHNAAPAIPVIHESVSVHKTLADNGGIRLRKVVHADVQVIDEELATQSVTLRRVPIGREVEGPVQIRYENGLTIIPVVEERLVVRRQLVLVEEIHVGHSTHVTRVPQSVTVRREEMIVERQAPGSDAWVQDAKESPGIAVQDSTPADANTYDTNTWKEPSDSL